MFRRTKDAQNSKLYSASEGRGRVVALLFTKGQRRDHHGAVLLLPVLPPARELLGDHRYDGNWFRAALAERDIMPCILSTRSHKVALSYDRIVYRQCQEV